MLTQSISRARTGLLLDQPFYGSLVMRLRPVEAPGLGTVGTNGTHLLYDPEYIKDKSPAEMKALLAHEVMHCAMGHIWRRDARDRQLWNEACDIAINQILRASGFKLPPTQLEQEEALYPNMSAEQIYSQRQRDQQKKTGGSCGGMMDPGQGAPKDEDGDGQGDKDGNGEGQSSSSSSQGLKAESDWRIAIEIAARGQQHGNLPLPIQRLIESMRESKVDWKTQLRRFVARVIPNDYSWVQPNRRFISAGLVLPGIIKEGTPRLGVAVDTSGSISNELLAEFGAELTTIIEECKPEQLDVVFCDADVQSTVTYFPGDYVDLAHDAKGGGGTAFEPALNHFTEHPMGPPVAVIYLTDGFAGTVQEEPPYPVIWAICPHGRNSQKFGEEVQIG